MDSDRKAFALRLAASGTVRSARPTMGLARPLRLSSVLFSSTIHAIHACFIMYRKHITIYHNTYTHIHMYIRLVTLNPQISSPPSCASPTPVLHLHQLSATAARTAAPGEGLFGPSDRLHRCSSRAFGCGHSPGASHFRARRRPGSAAGTSSKRRA